MKTASDPRHQKRVQIVQSLFAYTFPQDRPENFQQHPPPAEIIAALPTIDPLIEKAAPQFPIVNIAKVDVSILRLALFEILFAKNQPVKVVIDEAIELAKEYGGESSPSFINGVLGYILKTVPN